MTFGERFKAARVLLRLTQREAAERIGTTVPTISRWETTDRVPQTRPMREAAERLIAEAEASGKKEDGR